MFLELFYILLFIFIPLLVFLLKIKISNYILFLCITLFGLLSLLELFELIKLHPYVHYIVISFLYTLIWVKMRGYYSSIIHKKSYIGLSVFLHFVCVMFLILNHIIFFLNNPTYSIISDNIYAIETRNGGAWADENLVKVQVMQSYGILDIVKYSGYISDSEVRYEYDKMNNSLDISMRNFDSRVFEKVVTISL